MYDSSVKYTWQYMSSTVRLASVVMLEEEAHVTGCREPTNKYMCLTVHEGVRASVHE